MGFPCLEKVWIIELPFSLLGEMLQKQEDFALPVSKASKGGGQILTIRNSTLRI